MIHVSKIVGEIDAVDCLVVLSKQLRKQIWVKIEILSPNTVKTS